MVGTGTSNPRFCSNSTNSQLAAYSVEKLEKQLWRNLQLNSKILSVGIKFQASGIVPPSVIRTNIRMRPHIKKHK
jgi:hypothetical protein